MSSHEKGKRFFEYGTATKMPSGCFVYRLEEAAGFKATKITFTRIIGSGSCELNSLSI